MTSLSIDTGLLYYLYFDDVLIGTLYSLVLRTVSVTNSCGSSLLMDYPSIPTTGEVSHSASSVTLKIQAAIPSGSVTFGFRDVNLLFETSASTVTNTVCQYSLATVVQNSCLCGANSYNTLVLLCGSCDASCETCTGSSTDECLSCESGYSFDGETCVACDSGCDQCSTSDTSECIACSDGNYLYWNATCLDSCDSPLVTETSGDQQLCSLPCDDGEFYYYNDTLCYESCDAPLVSTSQGDLLLCSLPCDDGEFLYWNGSCIAECESPLVPGSQNGVLICELPCDDGEFYYYNDTLCYDSCDEPLVSGSLQGGDLLTCELPCETGEYFYWNETCGSTCETPLIIGEDNGVLTCSLPCEIGEWYYFNDSSCYSACDSPLIQAIQGDLQTCSFPCETGEYLYWNETCQSICEEPLITGEDNGVSTCSLPCEATEYYYLNGSCLDTCDSPYQERTDGDLKICYLDCPDSEFLYWNVTCLSTCDSPLVSSTEDGIEICSLPCEDSGYYYYSNGSCYEECDSPLVATSEGDLLLCNSPCDSTEFYFLDDSSCISSCDSPLVSEEIGILITCASSSSSSSASTLASTSDSSSDDSESTSSQLTISMQALSQTTSTLAVLSNILSSKDSKSFLVLTLFDLLNYIKYMDISYPDKVEELFDADSDPFSLSLSFSYNISSAFESQLPDRTIPSVFENRDLHSSFILNNWDPMTSMIVAVICVALYYPFSYLVTKIKIPFVIDRVHKLKSMLKWNLFLTYFMSDYAEIVLYSGLEFLSFEASSFMAVFSLLVAMFMIFLALTVFWKIIVISVEIIKEKKSSSSNSKEDKDSSENSEEEEQRWKEYEMLHEPYKNKSMFTQSFLFIYTLRIVLCYIIILTLYKYPVPQSIILTLFSLLSLIYAVLIKPMKEVLDIIENIVFEVIILIVNICVFVLAVLDTQEGGGSSAHRESLGTVIVVCNISARILSALLVFAALIVQAYEFYQCRRKQAGKPACLSLKKLIKKMTKPSTSSLSNQATMIPEEGILKDQKSVHFQRRAKKRKSTLETAREIIRKLFKSRSLIKKVAPEPYNVNKEAVKTETITAKKTQIVPKLSARRKMKDQKPTFIVTDIVVSSKEEHSGSEETPVRKKKNFFAEDYPHSPHNKSGTVLPLHKRWSKPSQFASPTNEPDLITNPATSLADFSHLNQSKMKTGSLIFDETERSLPQNLKRASKSIFNNHPQSEHSPHKTLKSSLLTHLEAPTLLLCEASPTSSLIQRSPRNVGGSSPSVYFGEGGYNFQQRKSPSLLEVSSSREMSFERKSLRNLKKGMLETIPEDGNKKEDVADIKIDMLVK